ncbi:sigma 54-interacting transcriptional regulator [Enterococcus faecium]|nr:sigma 54-interacting transcriptional regulator [Enterococcus faecium]
MKNSVEQAKAAILYPPRGLNCLITGPTGSGKTYFAHAMYHFAKAHHVIDEETELIVFNCADYANNPELLMSHLFGYAKVLLQAQMKKKWGLSIKRMAVCCFWMRFTGCRLKVKK